eukprot:TRINITY_DN16683_c0_g1_i1.p1 TRINITY_DN16683_c0_g1~~TRINITY_DN16683_c0_g1_i1.p1  ORF type:complete len:560 (-),score=121.56 TRINITY_DN16683_c0_g1_i1:69-1748(-)
MAPAKAGVRRLRALRSRRATAAARDVASTSRLESIVFGAAGLGDEDEDDKAAEVAAEEAAEGEDGDAASGAEEVGAVASRPAQVRAKKRRKLRAAASSKEPAETAAPAPAWVDPDDATLTVDLKAVNRRRKLRRDYDEDEIQGDEYERRLREHFLKLHGGSQWAQRAAADRDGGATASAAWASSDDEGPGGGEAVPSSSRGVLEKDTSGRLPPREVDVERLREVRLTPSEGNGKGPCTIQALQFHPNSELMLVAGMDKTLRLFAVDGDENPKVSSHFFKDYPIMGAKFLPSGDQILMTGLDHRLLGLDVRTGQSFRVRPFDAQSYRRFVGPFVGPSAVVADAGGGCPAGAPRSSQLFALLGDAGSVLLCDMRTKLPVRTLRMSSLGASAAFAHDRESLFTADQEAHLYEWDLGTGRCKQRVKNEHARRVSALALSRPTAFAPTPVLAVGSLSGEIDLFDVSGPKLASTPTKSIGSLVTRVSGVHFHAGGEVLAGFSQFKKQSLRLVHMGTGTVFANWPSARAPLHKVSALDFAPRYGTMAVGNERGKVLLYRLRHYEKN